MEEWKYIERSNGIYMVSTSGRVKNSATGTILHAYDNGKGYKAVMLYYGGKRHPIKIHRLVAEAFIDNPENKRCINHKDFDRNNNDVSNLEWVSYKENNIHSLCNRPIFNRSTTKTGFQYIIKLKNGSYRVRVKGKERRFKTLEEAIKYRDEEVRKYVEINSK